MALASAARSEPGAWPPAASINSRASLDISSDVLPSDEIEMRDQVGDFEQALDALVARDEREREPIAIRGHRPAGEQRQPGRVHELQSAQVDDQPPSALADLGQAAVELGHRAHVELAGRGHAHLAVAVTGDLDAERGWQELVGQGTPASSITEACRRPSSPEPSRPSPSRVRPPALPGEPEARTCEARTLSTAGTVTCVPPAKRLEVAIGDRTLSLSNLDKVLYPRAGFTKCQVIEYYTR